MTTETAQEKPWLSIQEIEASINGATASIIQRLCVNGDIHAIRVSKLWRIKSSEIPKVKAYVEMLARDKAEIAPGQDFVTAQQFAAHFDVSVATIHKLCNIKSIRGASMVGGRWVIPFSEIARTEKEGL